jgi:ATP-binding cassette subfamily B protein
MMELTKESLIEFVTSVGTLVLLWAGTLEVIKGNMTVGSLVTFYSLLNYFLSPIQNLVELQGTLQSALVAADRLNDILDLSPEASGDQDINEIHEIALEDVSFRYGNRDLILKNLSLSAHKGEQIALTGESGCGKSTVTKLLMGLYDPEKGSVKINGKDVKEYSLKAVRDRIAYVPQSTFFFADTIKANLFLGLEENKIPTEEELEKVLDLCCCDFIKRLPFGIESMLDENGANLSGGQRQRLAIARAILRKPELLILDEATSALDNITEYRIQSALRKLCSNMIVVTIAHRLSTVKSCNQILVMDQGLIVEKGTHKSLLEMDNKYAVLWKRQNENCSAA